MLRKVFCVCFTISVSFNGCRGGEAADRRPAVLRDASPGARSAHAEENRTVYAAHANNPFGPSGRMRTSGTLVNSEGRPKRGVVELYNMVSCSTGCNPLIYKGYGCYCGFLGSGFPVDGIDMCCKNHDWCYNTANCPMYLEYFVPYYWKCYKNKSLCAIDHLEWGGSGSCAQRLCECDRVLSECLSRFPCPTHRALCRSSPWRLLQNTLMIF